MAVRGPNAGARSIGVDAEMAADMHAAVAALLLHCAHGPSVHLAFLLHASCIMRAVSGSCRVPCNNRTHHTLDGLHSACIARHAHMQEGCRCGQACRAKANKTVKGGHAAAQCRDGPCPMLAADALKPSLGNHSNAMLQQPAGQSARRGYSPVLKLESQVNHRLVTPSPQMHACMHGMIAAQRQAHTWMPRLVPPFSTDRGFTPTSAAPPRRARCWYWH